MPKNKIDAILAIGGGSVIDCAKAIVGATYYEEDIWNLFITSAPINKSVSVFVVLTLSASGSEINMGTVISNPETNEKRVYKSPHLRLEQTSKDVKKILNMCLPICVICIAIYWLTFI